MKNKEFVRILKYMFFSASGTIIALVTQWALSLCLQNVTAWDANKTNVVAYVISMVIVVVWTFTVNRKFTFRASNNVPIAMTKVAIYYALYIPLSGWWFGVLVAKFGVPPILSHLINSAINFVLSFYYNKFVVFHGSIDSNVTQSDDKTSQAN